MCCSLAYGNEEGCFGAETGVIKPAERTIWQLLSVQERGTQNLTRQVHLTVATTFFCNIVLYVWKYSA
jgi:hypothetical protein